MGIRGFDFARGWVVGEGFVACCLGGSVSLTQYQPSGGVRIRKPFSFHSLRLSGVLRSLPNFCRGRAG